MNQKQKTHDPIAQTVITAGASGGDDLAAAQQQMSALLAAGDAAIHAALSQDSATFLSATQQRGGQ